MLDQLHIEEALREQHNIYSCRSNPRSLEYITLTLKKYKNKTAIIPLVIYSFLTALLGLNLMFRNVSALTVHSIYVLLDYLSSVTLPRQDITHF